VLSEFSKGGRSRLTLVVATPAGPSRREIVAPEGGFDFGVRKWRAFSRGQSLMLLGEGMPGSVKLLEVAEGRVVRSARRGGSFPFPSSMLVGMAVIQILPLLLSLALALLLTVQMRRHRVQEYVAAGQRRRFATLWQRALAQLVDAILLGLGFVPPMVWMGRMFSDPEAMFADQGPFFPIVYFGLLAAALAWGLLVLVAFSWFEGRSGKTPGKWLLGIRVLGSDLAPCGFGRALIRNLLTFVDGFFNFLVGALLVALTENWQRLGDLAARTVVVADEKVEPSASP
jgi:uncharacterized RDD family membrane protein YckC